MRKFLFQNVHIVDPQSSHHLTKQDIYIEEGNIVEIGKIDSLASEEVETISFSEKTHVSPGWLDLQTHLQDPGFEWKESMEHLTEAAIKGGFTALHCLLDIDPHASNSQVINSLQSKARSLPIDFLFAGDITRERKGQELAELYDMHLSGAVSFSDGSQQSLDSGILLRALQYSQTFQGLIALYPYDMGLIGDGQANEGKEAVSLGMKGMPMLAEVLGIERAIRLAEYAQTPLHFQPLTAYDGLSAIHNAKTSGVKLSAAVGIPYIALTDSALSTFDSVYKLFPPLRSEEQVQKLKEAIKNGWVDALCTCHLAQGTEEKNKEFGLAEYGMLGLQTAFPLIWEHLVEPGLLDLSQMVELLSINPRSILGIPCPRIESGKTAELTFFQPHINWTLTSKELPSKAKNSAFLDQPLKGKVAGIFTNQLFHPVTK